MKHHTPFWRDPHLDRRGIGNAGIAATVPAGCHADTAADGSVLGIAGGSVGQSAVPVRLERFEAFDDPDTAFQQVAAHRRLAVAQRIPQPELKPVHAKAVGQLVEQRFLHQSCLRHAETAKRARDRTVCVDCAADSAVVRHQIRP